jgi:hypothetical protein
MLDHTKRKYAGMKMMRASFAEKWERIIASVRAKTSYARTEAMILHSKQI